TPAWPPLGPVGRTGSRPTPAWPPRARPAAPGHSFPMRSRHVIANVVHLSRLTFWARSVPSRRGGQAGVCRARGAAGRGVMKGVQRLTVLGAGYLGITHAASMASLGFEGLGVGTNEARVRQLNAGHVRIYEPGLEELLRAGLDAGRVRFTTSYAEAAAFGDVHFICTGTPQQPGSDHADLSQVHACVATLAPLLDRPCLVVGKSTVPVGTARRLAGEIGQSGPAAEPAWNPERRPEGPAVPAP